jgi:hypothetical protein
MRRLGIVVVLAFCAVLGAMASCKQGVGERCQVQSDCEGGLTCNAATGTCEEGISSVDGSFIPDARVDGGPNDPDAELDAAPPKPDAMIDAVVP